MDPIPAIWRIDVEPDDLPSSRERAPWSGFGALASLVRDLRCSLEDLAGARACVSWFPRFDPEIASVYGRSDFAFREHAPLFDALRAAGDVFGIHVHYHRWDAQRGVTYSDHADRDWVSYCVDASVEAFEGCFGEPARRSSHGGYFFHDAAVERAVAAGIEVDVTPEPGLGAVHEDQSFGAYATAPSPDFREFPRRPYYPSRAGLGVPAATRDTALPMLVVPLTAYDYTGVLAPWTRRLANRIRSRPDRPEPLNPWKAWPDPHVYWDLMERAADEGPARYIAFAVRTDNPSSATHHRARMLLEYLPRHPIARRLRFVDPLSPEIRALAQAGMSAKTAH